MDEHLCSRLLKLEALKGWMTAGLVARQLPCKTSTQAEHMALLSTPALDSGAAGIALQHKRAVNRRM